MTQRSMLFVLLLLGAGCRSSREAVDAPPPPDPIEERATAARAVLENYCQDCHFSPVSTASPKALDVFDLSDDGWAERLKERQLHEAAAQLAGIRGPTHARPATATELALFRAFLDDELRRRATGVR